MNPKIESAVVIRDKGNIVAVVLKTDKHDILYKVEEIPADEIGKLFEKLPESPLIPNISR